MANRYSKANTQKKDGNKSEFAKYEEQRKRLNSGARIMAIIVSIAMIVTAFLSAGVFFLK